MLVWCATLLFLMLPWRHSHAICGDSKYTQPGHVLINHLIESFTDTSIMDCIQKCDKIVYCHSINMYTDRGLCELNSATHLSAPEDFVPASHHVSYMMYSLHPGVVCTNHFCSDPGKRCILKGPVRSCHACVNSLGMEDGRITDEQITASSWRSYKHAPNYSRLNNKLLAGCWAASSKNVGEYLQIDLGKPMIISKVATQARYQSPYFQWVSKYYLTYSMDDDFWLTYKYQNQVKEFQGNYDKYTVVTNSLPLAIQARYIRIVVLKWRDYISMRAELYGCTPP